MVARNGFANQRTIAALRLGQDEPVHLVFAHPFEHDDRIVLARQFGAGKHEAAVTLRELFLDACEKPCEPRVLARIHHHANRPAASETVVGVTPKNVVSERSARWRQSCGSRNGGADLN